MFCTICLWLILVLRSERISTRAKRGHYAPITRACLIQMISVKHHCRGWTGSAGAGAAWVVSPLCKQAGPPGSHSPVNRTSRASAFWAPNVSLLGGIEKQTDSWLCEGKKEKKPKPWDAFRAVSRLLLAFKNSKQQQAGFKEGSSVVWHRPGLIFF